VILVGDILRWVLPKVGKFQKNVRYGSGACAAQRIFPQRRRGAEALV